VASGFGGNGFVTGPAAGRVVCDLVTTGTTGVDLSGLGLHRFAAQPHEISEPFTAWWSSPERERETAAWDVAGVRPHVTPKAASTASE
jgi:hypothetical protein